VRDDDTSGLADDAKRDLMPPDDIGVGIASALLGEIAQSGVVDSTHQVSLLAVSSPLMVLYQMIDTGIKLIIMDESFLTNRKLLPWLTDTGKRERI